MCFTWSNSNGKLCPFVNEEVLTCFTDYKIGQTIPGNGKFILGQEQDAYGTVELITSFLSILNIARLGVVETSFFLIFTFTSYAFW